MLGGTSGAKFVVNFSIEGSGERDLQRIHGLFKGIQKSIDGEGGGGHGEGIAGLGDKAMAGMHAMEKMAEAGAGLVESGVGIMEVWGKGFEVLLHKGTEFESLILRIQGSGKTRGEAIGMMNEALKITQMLPLTEMDAARITQTFSTIHIDATKRIGDSYEQLAAKQKTMKGLDEIIGVEKMKKEGPRAVTVVADMLAAMGHLGTGYQQQAIHEMMVTLETGKIMSKLTFAGLGGDLEKFRRLLQQAKDPAARLAAMQEILSKRGALGLSQASMNTWGGVMSNFKGIIDQLSYGILQPGKAGGLLSQLTKGAKELYETFKVFFDENDEKGAKFLDTLRSTFSMVGGWMTAAAKQLGKAMAAVFDFMAEHPLVMKMIAGLSILTGVVLIAGGAFISMSAALGGVIVALIAMPEILAAPLAMLGALPPLMIALGGAFVFASAAVAAWEADFGGIRTTFEDVKLVIEAVLEALDDWHGGMASISEDTAQTLEKQGLMGTFLTIVNYIRQAEMAYHGFMDGFSQKWEIAYPKFVRAWNAIDGAMSRIMEAVKSILVAFGAITNIGANAVQDATNTGEDWGTKVGQIADSIASFAETTANFISGMVETAPEMIHQFAQFYGMLLYTRGVLTEMWGVANVAFDVLKIGISSVMSVLSPLVDLLKTAVQVQYALARGDWSGAYDAVATGLKKAAANREYWNQATVNGMKALPGDLDTIDKGVKEQAEAAGKSAAFESNALMALGAIRTGMKPPETPGMIGPPASPSTWDQMDKEERQRFLDNSPRQDRTPRQPLQITTTLVLEKEVLAKHVAEVKADQHEQGGGHAVHP